MLLFDILITIKMIYSYFRAPVYSSERERERESREITRHYNMRYLITRRSVDVVENTFNLMLLALLLYFGILFCVQGFLLISVSYYDTGEKLYYVQLLITR